MSTQQCKGEFSGDEIHCLRRLRRNDLMRLSRSWQLVQRSVARLRGHPCLPKPSLAVYSTTHLRYNRNIPLAISHNLCYNFTLSGHYSRHGWIPEWPKGTDCKSAANCFGGSNPPPPITRSGVKITIVCLRVWRNRQTQGT